MAASDLAQSVAELDALARRLRRECPWDREQDERSVVPHTVEEAYELADAANLGDDAKLLDELGDVLFQVVFLALLLEERGAGDLTRVAEHCRQKLIRRHPHVFGESEVADASEVLRNWDAIKATEPGREPGLFGEVPENLPALLYARKLQRRAVSAGLHPAGGTDRAAVTASADAEKLEGSLVPRARSDEPTERTQDEDAQEADARCFRDVGERLFALVEEARVAKVDPELALRAAAQRFREQIENGER
jgi:MazG family protein